jgi:hypothetical protein
VRSLYPTDVSNLGEWRGYWNFCCERYVKHRFEDYCFGIAMLGCWRCFHLSGSQ